ncbi:MAG: CBS domain-containing protein [Selenomonadaceae bacterium]
MAAETVIRAKDIMAKKLITVGPKETVQEVARLLVEHNISGVPVVDETGKLLGIISEGDLLHKEVAPKLPNMLNILGAIIFYNGVKEYKTAFQKMLASTAEEIMTKRVVSVAEDADISEIGELMLEHHIKRVPVVREGILVGIIGRNDMMRLLLE